MTSTTSLRLPVLSRRTTLAGLVALTGAGLLTACGGGEDGSDVSDKTTGAMSDFKAGSAFKATTPLTFTSLFSDHPNYPYTADWLFFTSMQEQTGVTLDFTIVPMSDYEQKRSLVVSAGDAPLIIPKTYPGQETPFVASGVVLPVSDHLDLMPNFREKIDAWQLEPELETLMQEDGKSYVLPGVHESVPADYTVIVRTDVFEALGIATPTTWEEFAGALATIKQANPGSIPFSDRYEGQCLLDIAGTAFGARGGWGYGEGLTYEEAKGEFVLTAATQQYQDLVTYLAGLVADGLLDPESFTQQDDQAADKFVTGRSFAICGNSQDPSTYRAQMDATLGAGNYSIAKIPVPAGPAGDDIANSRLENGIMISAKAAEREDFQALMQYLDWLYYSDAGREFAKWGVEGTTYTKDAAGKRTLAADVNYLSLNPAGTKDLRKDFGFSQGNFSYGGSTELNRSMMPEEELAFQDGMAGREAAPPLPAHPYSQVEQEQVTLLRTPLEDYVEQATLQFITGQRDLSEYPAFIAELEERGSARYLEMANGALATKQ